MINNKVSWFWKRNEQNPSPLYSILGHIWVYYHSRNKKKNSIKKHKLIAASISVAMVKCSGSQHGGQDSHKGHKMINWIGIGNSKCSVWASVVSQKINVTDSQEPSRVHCFVYQQLNIVRRRLASTLAATQPWSSEEVSCPLFPDRSLEAEVGYFRHSSCYKSVK